MRISTNTLYQNGIARISSMQAEQSKLQQQISASKRILTPSDDPVAARRKLASGMSRHQIEQAESQLAALRGR